jgi:hypothetical protein
MPDERKVFLSYASQDRERARLMADYLTRKGVPVWWDRDLLPGDRFRAVIDEQLDRAACTIALFTAAALASRWVPAEAEHADRRGVLIPVKMDPAAEPPKPFSELHVADLTNWSGEDNDETRKILAKIAILRERPRTDRYTPMLAEGDSVTTAPLAAAAGLRNLSARVRSLTEVLTLDAGPARDLGAALDEVNKTYTAVSDAIRQFIEPALKPGDLDSAPYMQFERGGLVTLIRSRIGHCHRIGDHYNRAGGLREWLETRLESTMLAELDQVMNRLSNADGNLFEQLGYIGNVLQNESIAITTLLLEEEKSAARRRVIEARKLLMPLEQELAQAMGELQNYEAAIGYAATD